MTWHYVDGVLHVEDIPVPEVADRVGTPVYIYSLDEITRRVRLYQQAFPEALIAYAYKANANPGLVAHLAALGCGADVVSAGELRVALAAGVPPERIVLNGNAKGDEEIALALRVGVRSLNLDAVEEIPRVAAVARELGVVAPVALRINPGMDVRTHPHLRVGAAGSHFGIPVADVLTAAAKVASSPYLRLRGLHIHAGSQLTDLEELAAVAQVAVHWARTLAEAGYSLEEVNLGGGLGISYTGGEDPGPEEVVRRWRPYLEGGQFRLIIEPGRWLVAPAGVLVVRVVQVKQAWGRTFVAVDGGMNALLRPALYGARHRIVPVRQGEDPVPVDVVGPICESADVLGRDYPLPPLKNGDLLAILDVGAYGRSMASTYNGRPLPGEVLVRGGRWELCP